MDKRLIIGALSISLMGGTGYQFLRAQEGEVLSAYLDGGGVATICVGHTKGVKLGDRATREVCDQLLKEDVSEAEAAIKKSLPAHTRMTVKQFLAVVSFVFNFGQGNFNSSTLKKKIIADDCWGAGLEFPRWNRIKGVPSKGLDNRRKAERELWESGCSLNAG